MPFGKLFLATVPNVPGSTQRQSQPRQAARSLFPVFQRETAAVGFGNLAAQRQPDARSARFGGEERHKQIRGGGKSRPFVLNPYFQLRAGPPPADLHLSFG